MHTVHKLHELVLCAGRKNGQDAKWLQQVRRSGTTSDKVAALTLLLQENAVANLRSLDALLTWVLKRKGGRNVVAQVGHRICLLVCAPCSFSHCFRVFASNCESYNDILSVSLRQCKVAILYCGSSI